jgi:hypothetical protein
MQDAEAAAVGLEAGGEIASAFEDQRRVGLPSKFGRRIVKVGSIRAVAMRGVADGKRCPFGDVIGLAICGA